MADKDFKTIEEQLDILRTRGLTINDETQARDFLLRNNYYRISGYSLTLRKNDIFFKSATFQNIIDIYYFDHELRHILLQYLEVIEVQMKSISDISFLYSISEQPIKDAVARAFNLTMKKGATILGSYMHSMTIIRNLCAHGSRIYNRLFEQKPSLNKKEKALLRKSSNGEIDNAHFYGFLLVMKRILPADKFSDMKDSIISLTRKYPFVRMDYYGFRSDWQQKL